MLREGYVISSINAIHIDMIDGNIVLTKKIEMEFVFSSCDSMVAPKLTNAVKNVHTSFSPSLFLEIFFMMNI